MYLYTGSLLKLFQFLTFIINHKQATKIATDWVIAYPMDVDKFCQILKLHIIMGALI